MKELLVFGNLQHNQFLLSHCLYQPGDRYLALLIHLVIICRGHFFGLLIGITDSEGNTFFSNCINFLQFSNALEQ